MSDESLAGTVEPTPDTPLAPETFDLSAWVRGVQPTRRSVIVYQRPDLLAEIDTLTAREAVAPKGEREGLAERAADVTQQLRESAVTFVVEGRTSAWVKEFTAENRDQDATNETLRQLAAQIVEPSGVTFEMVRALADVTEPQVVKLVEAMLAANSSAPRIDPRFSRAS